MGKLGASLTGYQEPEPQQIDLNVTGRPEPVANSQRSVTKKPQPKPTPTTGAKYNDPAFQQLKVYVRRATKTRASRKWEDEGRGDMSDLIEILLTQYLSS